MHTTGSVTDSVTPYVSTPHATSTWNVSLHDTTGLLPATVVTTVIVCTPALTAALVTTADPDTANGEPLVTLYVYVAEPEASVVNAPAAAPTALAACVTHTAAA